MVNGLSHLGVVGRAASFCSAAAAQFDRADQGLSFFSQNASWLQPPGHVHAMISGTWAEQTLRLQSNNSTAAACPTNVSVAAQRSLDGRLVIRAVNAGTRSMPLEFRLRGAAVRVGPSRMRVLRGAAGSMDNTLASPFNVAPVARVGPVWDGGTVLEVELEALSFVVVETDLVG